jgi:sulfatase maturation enzyme AslB (radical SAM superfamily)
VTTAIPAVLDAAQAPLVRLHGLDVVWLQLTGTLCNIACRHCFVSCGPREDRVPMMSRTAALGAIDEAAALGVRELYFTGGEPMMHPDFWEICEHALGRLPLTVLTNGIGFDDDAAARAGRLFTTSRHSFDLRISLDGMSAAENDPVRGRGTFDAVVAGLRRLAAAGVVPAITVVEHAPGMAAADARAAFLAFARSLGLAHPRVKFLPLLRVGREIQRSRGYVADELDGLAAPLDSAVEERLVCATARLVAAGGVYTCPILLDAPEARLGATLTEARRDIRLRWAACRTCVVEGLSCHT